MLKKKITKRFMKSVNCSKPGYASITRSKIEHIPYNLTFATKFNDSSILITIISWDYLNLSFGMNMSQYQPRLCCSRRISQSEYSIHIKLNYCKMYKVYRYPASYVEGSTIDTGRNVNCTIDILLDY